MLKALEETDLTVESFREAGIPEESRLGDFDDDGYRGMLVPCPVGDAHSAGPDSRKDPIPSGNQPAEQFVAIARA